MSNSVVVTLLRSAQAMPITWLLATQSLTPAERRA
jgi:hypothetical protein